MKRNQILMGIMAVFAVSLLTAQAMPTAMAWTAAERADDEIELVNVFFTRPENQKGGDDQAYDTATVIYKITAGETGVRNAQVLIETDSALMIVPIQNLAAHKSTVHQMYVPVQNLDSVSVSFLS